VRSHRGHDIAAVGRAHHHRRALPRCAVPRRGGGSEAIIVRREDSALDRAPAGRRSRASRLQAEQVQVARRHVVRSVGGARGRRWLRIAGPCWHPTTPPPSSARSAIVSSTARRLPRRRRGVRGLTRRLALGVRAARRRAAATRGGAARRGRGRARGEAAAELHPRWALRLLRLQHPGSSDADHVGTC
jgi:hypothetical protein